MKKTKTMGNVLVTGGAGYIGSHVVYELIDHGYDVTILDDLSLGDKKNIDPRAKFILDSTSSYDTLNNICKECDAVIHLAAFKAAGESMLDPIKYSQNNIINSMNVLNACVNNNINKIIFSSTAAVYGEPKYLPIDEEHETTPVNYYGATKLMFENNLNWLSKISGLRFAILRYFNAAGYDMNKRITGIEKKPQNLIPLVMEVAYGKRNKLNVFGNDYSTKDGTGVRDYIHVTDLANAHIKSLKYIDDVDENLIINLGTETGYSVLEIINMIENISGNKIRYNITNRREGDLAILLASYKKANKLLDWEPKNSKLENIIQSTCDIYDQL